MKALLMLVAQNLLERVDNQSWSSLWSPRFFYDSLLGQGIRYVNEYILWFFFLQASNHAAP
jgi:hypothetical protein